MQKLDINHNLIGKTSMRKFAVLIAISCVACSPSKGSDTQSTGALTQISTDKRPVAGGEGTRPGESTDGMDMQRARAKMMKARGEKKSYTKSFDISGIPKYQPKKSVAGTIKFRGSNYITDGQVGKYWEKKFQEYHPNVRFDWNMKTSRAAVPSLALKVADIGIARKVTFGELQLFQRELDHDPIEIEIATGSYNMPGWQPGYGVIVHKDNPLQKVTMQQLDGIFGAERAGGWDGTTWKPGRARGPEENIRTWGELGLKGKWADIPINVYGLNLRYHQAEEISDMVLQSSDKWNEGLKIYANYVTADGKLARNMNDDLAADQYGIGIVAAPTTKLGGTGTAPTTKILPVAENRGSPYVPYTLETIQNRSYPMHDEIYAYADVHSSKSSDAAVVEFLRFVLSREGQALVMKDGKYLPLTSKVAIEQMRKLDAATVKQ